MALPKRGCVGQPPTSTKPRMRIDLQGFGFAAI